MMAIRKEKLADDEVVVCINDSGCAQVGGQIFFFHYGSRHKASDPVVQANRDWFVSESTSDAERETARREMYELHYSHPAPPAQAVIRREPPKRLRAADAVVPRYG